MMCRFFYSTLYRLLFPFVLLRLLYRSRKAPAYAQRWRERLGFFESPRLNDSIWVHAVSVGETVAAVPMIRQLLTRYPDQSIVVTTMTPTGSERVQSLLGDDVFHVYAPYDTPGSMIRFLDRIRPGILVIMETELWPNMVHLTHARHIPVVLANGRLSEKSAKGYQKVRGLALPMLQEIDRLVVQSDEDAQRFQRLGVSADRLTVTGSIKFDFTLSVHDLEKGEILKSSCQLRPVWVAASTHEGEDEQVLAAHRHILQKFPAALLILVPRHPERFDTVSNLTEALGFSAVRRSGGEPLANYHQVLVGDTMGEMICFFAAAQVAFVGGSLIERGGHNPLEPAALSLPVLSGPHVFNFEKVYHQLSEQGAVKFVGSSDLLANRVIEFFEDDDYRRQTGNIALQILNKNKGALERLLSIIDEEKVPSV